MAKPRTSRRRPARAGRPASAGSIQCECPPSTYVVTPASRERARPRRAISRTRSSRRSHSSRGRQRVGLDDRDRVARPRRPRRRSPRPTGTYWSAGRPPSEKPTAAVTVGDAVHDERRHLTGLVGRGDDPRDERADLADGVLLRREPDALRGLGEPGEHPLALGVAVGRGLVGGLGGVRVRVGVAGAVGVRVHGLGVRPASGGSASPPEPRCRAGGEPTSASEDARRPMHGDVRRGGAGTAPSCPRRRAPSGHPRPGANSAATAATATAAAPVSRAGPIAPSYPLGVSVAAVAEEDRDQERDAERDAELTDRGVGRAGDREVVRPAARRAPSVAIGANVRPMPTPAISSGTTNDEYERAVLGEHGEPDQRHRLQDQAGDEQRAEPGAGRRAAPAIGATTIGAAVHGSVRSPASSGL